MVLSSIKINWFNAHSDVKHHKSAKCMYQFTQFKLIVS